MATNDHLDATTNNDVNGDRALYPGVCVRNHGIINMTIFFSACPEFYTKRKKKKFQIFYEKRVVRSYYYGSNRVY